MSARVLLALLLLLLCWALTVWNGPFPVWVLALCLLYLVCTAVVYLLAQPRKQDRAFGSQWLYVLGVDLACFLLLNFQLSGSINFAPLLAVPVLEAALFGARVPLGMAALTALLLTGNALFEASRADWQHTDGLVQAVLTGSALLVLGWLTSRLTARLAHEEVQARRSGDEARIQAQVNGMVIESLADGILVVDPQHTVQAANPAAYQMLGAAQIVPPRLFSLNGEPAWRALADLADQTFAAGSCSATEITLALPDQRESHLRVRTERTPASALGEERRSLCVMFLQDTRELQAQLRTEKLAAMGRMSAAVAHEIRNPLAAIVQANALLAEDLPGPAAQRLTAIVRQNAERLGRIVDDILDVARVRGADASGATPCAPLDELTLQACQDWSRQHAAGLRLAVTPHAQDVQVQCSPEHLRRILVNLLDNAARYASARPGAIRVETCAADGPPVLCVWSDGAPLEPSVQRHLFEPFFSSESRSSGLGLYICQELCERHDAVIAYERTLGVCDGATVEGNEFRITFRRAPADTSGNAEWFDDA